MKIPVHITTQNGEDYHFDSKKDFCQWAYEQMLPKQDSLNICHEYRGGANGVVDAILKKIYAFAGKEPKTHGQYRVSVDRTIPIDSAWLFWESGDGKFSRIKPLDYCYWGERETRRELNCYRTWIQPQINAFRESRKGSFLDYDGKVYDVWRCEVSGGFYKSDDIHADHNFEKKTFATMVCEFEKKLLKHIKKNSLSEEEIQRKRREGWKKYHQMQVDSGALRMVSAEINLSGKILEQEQLDEGFFLPMLKHSKCEEEIESTDDPLF